MTRKQRPTVSASELAERLHVRMPAVLRPDPHRLDSLIRLAVELAREDLARDAEGKATPKEE